MGDRTKILLEHLRFFSETDDAFFILPGSRDDAVEVLRVVGYLPQKGRPKVH